MIGPNKPVQYNQEMANINIKNESDIQMDTHLYDNNTQGQFYTQTPVKTKHVEMGSDTNENLRSTMKNSRFKDYKENDQPEEENQGLLLNDHQSFVPLEKPDLRMMKQQKQAENSLHKSAKSLHIRKCFRMLLLILLEGLIIGIIVGYYYNAGMGRKSLYFDDNQSFSFNIKKCSLKINDYSSNLLQEQDLNFLATTNIPTAISQNIFFQYTLPNSGLPGEGSSTSYSVDENGVHTFSIENNQEFQVCEIAFYVYKQTTINSLTINCEREDCFIISKSKSLMIDSLDIKGYSVQLNMIYLKSKTLNFLAFFGSVEINDAYFTSALIDVSTGDISIQSTESIIATLDMVKPLYCASTSSTIPITSTIVQNTNTCTSVFPFENTSDSQTNAIAERCYKGVLTILSSGNETPQKLTASSTYGNVYLNVLQSAGSSATFNNQFHFDKTIYGDAGDTIGLSDLSISNINSQISDAISPNVYDPVFLLYFGSKFTQSNTFTQWQVTFNPAYSYLKPWWLGILTYTLLNPAYYEQNLILAPGFCPYVPSMTQDRIYKIQELVTTTFSQDNEKQQVISFSWQDGTDLPIPEFVASSTYNGDKQLNILKNYQDSWINLIKEKDGTIIVNYLDFSKNGVLYASVVVSLILAVIVGLVFMVGIIFLINRNYLFLLDHISHVDSYEEIVKENQKFNENEQHQGAPHLNIKQETRLDMEQKEDDLLEKQQEEKLKKLQSKEQKQFKYSVTSLFNLFYTLVFLSPPLSAYIDQVVILFSKARANSISNFYQILFKKVKGQDEFGEDSIHNLEKDSISGQEMKVLYEQYCYLNRLLERKIDEDQSRKMLKSRGFKISIKQDTLVSYYTYIKYSGQARIANFLESKHSLDMFINSCCKLTKFDCDSIDSLTFEKLYLEFCYSNHLEPIQLNERELKREYGIETRLLPQQVVERDPAYDITDPKNPKFNIEKSRVQNNFNILLAKSLQDLQLTKTDPEELNDAIVEIYTPRGWVLYDLLTVIAHLLVIFFLGIPIIGIVLFVRIQQSSYLLIPTSRIIYQSDLLYSLYLLPIKLINDSELVQAITIISIIFWALSTWDLLYYYLLMSFPQERYFQNYSKAKTARKVVSRVMWIIVLIAIYLIVIYICLTIIWLILGAIINPEAFLPYASSVATLVTIIGKKYNDFKMLTQQGFEKLMSYIQTLNVGQFQEIIKKMDISEGSKQDIPTNEIKQLVEEAAKLNIIEAELSQSIQNNLEIMLRDPSAVAFIGKEVFEIANNPKEYTIKLQGQIDDKVQEQLQDNIKQYLPNMCESFIATLQKLLRNSKQDLKQNMTVLFQDFVTEYQNLVDSQHNNEEKLETKFKQLQILKGPILQLIHDIVYPDETQKIDEIKSKLVKNVCSVIYSSIIFHNQEKAQQEEIFMSLEKSNLNMTRKEAEKNQQKEVVKRGKKQKTTIIRKDHKDEEKQTLLRQGSQNKTQRQENGEKNMNSQNEENDEAEEEDYYDHDSQEQYDGDFERISDFEDDEDDKGSQKNNNDDNEEMPQSRQNLVESVVLHLIQIFKYSQEKSETELLNEILGILRNRQIVSESQTLVQISSLQDIFTLLLELNDNYGIVNIQSIFKKVKQFLLSTVEQQSQEAYKCSLVTMYEILYECLFSHMQSLPVRKFMELKNICSDFYSNQAYSSEEGNQDSKELELEIDDDISQREDKVNGGQKDQIYKESMGALTSFVSYWLQGSLMNIPSDGIKDILFALSEHFPEYNQIFYALKQTGDNTRDKSSKKLTQQIKKVQIFFNLIDILINNPDDQIKKLKKCSQKIYGVKREFSQFTTSCFKIKFKNLTDGNDFKIIAESFYFAQIAKYMKIPPSYLIGLLYIPLNKIYMRETHSTLKMIFSQNKIAENRIEIFSHLYNLLCSDKEKIILSSLQFFRFNELQFYIQNDSSDSYQKVKLLLDDFAIILLFLRGKYSNKELFWNRIGQLFMTLFGSISQEKILKVDNCKILFQQLSFRSELVTAKLKTSEIQQGFFSLTSVDKLGLISMISVNQILNLFSFEGSNSSFAPLLNNEIQVFSKLLSLRNIQFISGELSSQLIKDSVQDIASVLNIDEYLVFNFFNMFTSTQPEKIVKIFQQFSIEPKTQEEIKYLEQCTTVIGGIEERWYMIEQIQEGMFSQKIPLTLFQEMLLFSRLPSDSDTLYFILNKFYKNPNPKIKAFINFKYNIQSKKYESLQTVFRKIIGGDKSNQGFFTIIEIFNSSITKVEKIKLFLQYLLNSQKSLPLLIGCFYSFFGGEGYSVQLDLDTSSTSKKTNSPQDAPAPAEKQSIQFTVEQLLSRRLDIKPEFLNALPSLFITDTYLFAQQFIKFFRQIDYQLQREQIKQSSSAADSQQKPAAAVNNANDLKKEFKSQKTMLKLERKSITPSASVSKHKFTKTTTIMDNIVNKVTAQDKEVEQFIRLISGNTINTSFFSRELQLPIDVVELISMISTIQNCKTKEKRLRAYDTLICSSSVQKVFSLIGIQAQEFIDCVKFIYSDFEINESSSLQQGLKLPLEFSFTALQNLLILDAPLAVNEDPLENRKKLHSSLRSNQLIKELQMDIQLVSLLYALQGDYLLLRTFSSGEIQMLSFNSPQFIQIFQGLSGCLSKRKMNTDSSDFFKQIYYKLKAKNGLRGNFYADDLKDQKKKSKTEDDSDLESSVQELKKANTYEYSIYLLCKQLYVSPMWMLLMSGNVETWNELCTTYHRFYKYEKPKYYHNNPLQALIIILRLKECPTLVKELLIQNELAISAPLIFKDDHVEEDDDSTIKDLLEMNKKLKESSNSLLENLLKRPISSFIDLAQRVQFPFKILRLIASYEYQERIHLFQNIKFTDKMIEHVLQKSSSHLDIINEQKAVYTERSRCTFFHDDYYNSMKSIYKKVNLEFCNYTKQDQGKHAHQIFNQKRINEYFGENEIMQLILCSTMSNLQTSYFSYQDLSDRDSEHYKLVCYEIDLLLSTLETFYFFKPQMTKFNKFRFFTLTGLTCGFSLNVRDILSCQPYSSLYDQTHFEMVRKELDNGANLLGINKNYFKKQVLPSLLRVIQYREKPAAELYDIQETNYFRIIQGNTYNGLVKKEWNSINPQTMLLIIENFEDSIIPYFTQQEYPTVYHLFSNENQLTRHKDEELKIQATIQNDNFMFMIDFLKQNYKAISQYDFFVQKYEADLKYFTSILSLNGSFVNNRREHQVEDFLDSLSVMSQYLLSNKKSLSQIISLFMNGIDYNLSCLFEVIQMKQQALKCFTKISLDVDQYYIEDEIEYLLSQTRYSDTNKWVIKNIMLLYQGDLQRLMSLVQFSNYFKETKYKSYMELHKFLQAIETNHLHSIKQDEARINILNQLYISSEKRENKLLQDEMIFMICNSVVQTNGLELDPRIVDNDPNSKHQFLEEYYKLTSIIRDICSNKWDFIWKFDQDEQSKKSFCSLFDLTPETLDIIYVLSILKPEVTGLTDIKKVNSCLSKKQINKFLEKIVNFGIELDEDEKMQLTILMIVTNRSLPHLVDTINDLIVGNKNKLDRKESSATEFNQTDVEREELAVILQSVLLAKQATQFSWYDIYQDLKENHGRNSSGQLHLTNDNFLQQLNKMISCILHSFDSISSVFLTDLITDKNQNEDQSLASHPTGLRRQATKKKLIDFQKFDLDFFLALNNLKQTQVFKKSSLILHYLQKALTQTGVLIKGEDDFGQRFIEPHQLSNYKEIRIAQKKIKTFYTSDQLQVTTYNCQKLTSLIFGQPFFTLSKYNPIVKMMLQASKVFVKNDLSAQSDNFFHHFNTEINISSEESRPSMLRISSALFSQVFKFFFLCFYSEELSEQSKRELFDKQIQSINGLAEVCLSKKWNLRKQVADVKSSENKERVEEIEFINQIVTVINGRNVKQSYLDLQQEFTNYLITGFSEINDYFDRKKLLRIYKKLQILLDRPLINLEDKNTLDDLMLLLKCIDIKYIDRNLVRNTVKIIVNGDYNSLLQIIDHSGIIPPNDLRIIKESIAKVSNLSIFKAKQSKSILKGNYQPVVQDQLKDIVKRIEEGKITIKDMFHSIDSQGDGNGLISLSEFCNFLRRTGIQMSEHRTNELFASIRKNRTYQTDESEDTQLTYEEFEEAFKYITQKKADMSLEILGISPALLALSLGTLIIILLLLLVFIFLGIKAFALGGTFGSIINSIIPVAATSGTATTQDDKEESLKDDNIEGVVKDTQQILHTNQL